MPPTFLNPTWKLGEALGYSTWMHASRFPDHTSLLKIPLSCSHPHEVEDYVSDISNYTRVSVTYHRTPGCLIWPSHSGSIFDPTRPCGLEPMASSARVPLLCYYYCCIYVIVQTTTLPVSRKLLMVCLEVYLAVAPMAADASRMLANQFPWVARWITP